MAGDIFTASGTRFFIGPAATSAIDSPAEFAALAWVEVGLVENLGEFGDESSSVTFAALGDGRIRKAKGARDAGSLALIVGRDASDLGQEALVAAEGTNLNYAFKVEYPNKPNPGGTNEIEYFRALVMSKRGNIGTNDNVVRRTFNLGINSQIYTVEPAWAS